MSSSIERVFGTFELLADIFSHLDYKDILRCQRVCRTWQGVVRGSPTVRQAAWYPPYEPPGSDTWTYKPPRLQKAGLGTTGGYPIYELHPVLKSLRFRLDTGFSYDNFTSFIDGWDISPELNKFRIRPGSWSNMLATSPPCPELWVEFIDVESTYRVIKPGAGKPVLLHHIFDFLAESYPLEFRARGTGRLRPITPVPNTVLIAEVASADIEAMASLTSS